MKLNEVTVMQLLDDKTIGRRLFSLLQEAKINNLDDLQVWFHSMGIDSLSQYKNFGAKCREELEEVISRYPELTLPETPEGFDPSQTPLIMEAAADLQSRIEGIDPEGNLPLLTLRQVFDNAAQIITWTIRNAILPRLDKYNLEPQQRFDTWCLLLDLLHDALNSDSLRRYPLFEAHLTDFIDQNEKRLAKLKWDKLSLTYSQPLVHRQLQEEYEAIINSYPKRSQNAAYEYFPDYREAMMRFCLDHVEMTEMHNCGNKSFKDLMDIFNEFYETSPDIFSLSGEDLELNALEAQFPQLAGSGTRFVYDFREAHGRLPLWYILSRFILTDPHQVIVHFRTVHGIGRGRNYGFSSNTSNYSGDGLNEMLQQADFDIHCPGADDPAWNVYPFLRLPIIGPESFDFEALSRDENLSDLTFDNFLGLLQFLRGGKIFTINRVRYWIPEDVAAEFPVREIVKQLEDVNETERDTYTTIDVRNLFTFRDDRPLDHTRADVTRAIGAAMGFEILPDEFSIGIQPNTINVSDELIKILYDAPEPMSLSDILAEFQKRFPGHKVNNERLMRQHINHTQRIILVNRRRGYTLVERMVEESEQNRMLQEPEAAPKPQPKRAYRVRRSKNDPFPFYTMLIEFRNFIDENGRFPSLDSDNPEEVVLKTWRDDMLLHGAKCTPAEYQDLLRTEYNYRRKLLNMF